MKSEATNVTAYLASVPEERRDAITRLRSLYASAFKGCEETIDYGVPCYKRDGKMVAGFASQKRYIALYGMGEVAQRYSNNRTDRLQCWEGNASVSVRAAKMDFDLIQRMLKDKV